MLSAAAVLILAFASPPRFYPDDPLEREPKPLPVKTANPRKLSDWYDLLHHVVAEPGEKHSPAATIAARDVNTVGEVLEGAWYEKRHAKRRMTAAELRAGPGNQSPPAEGEWLITGAKNQGITPGFQIEDRVGRRYFIKFDPLGYPELATAADMIGSKIFHALGYHVPENYIVRFGRSRLRLREGATIRDAQGRKRALTAWDVSQILRRSPRLPDGGYRATASLLIPGRILGEFRYYGTRSDDPNDTVPHEHRRSLRGLHVFCAWLNHEDSRAINTLDTLIDQHIKHYLIDFGSTLGSASSGPNSPRSGFEQFFTWRSSALEFFTLGAYIPQWARIRYPNLPSVGRFPAERFDPIEWTPEYPNPAFDNRLAEDTFWAAAQVAEFTDADIRELVRVGEYSDPVAERYVGDALISRRDAIVRAYLRRPGLLLHPRVEDGEIRFDDAGVRFGGLRAPPYSFHWTNAETGEALPGNAPRIPATHAELLAVEVRAGNESARATIYLRNAGRNPRVLGINRVF